MNQSQMVNEVTEILRGSIVNPDTELIHVVEDPHVEGCALALVPKLQLAFLVYFGSHPLANDFEEIDDYRGAERQLCKIKKAQLGSMPRW